MYCLQTGIERVLQELNDGRMTEESEMAKALLAAIVTFIAGYSGFVYGDEYGFLATIITMGAFIIGFNMDKQDELKKEIQELRKAIEDSNKKDL